MIDPPPGRILDFTQKNIPPKVGIIRGPVEKHCVRKENARDTLIRPAPLSEAGRFLYLLDRYHECFIVFGIQFIAFYVRLLDKLYIELMELADLL